jgi:hypothetical protein
MILTFSRRDAKNGGTIADTVSRRGVRDGP